MLIITGTLAFDQILNLPGKFSNYILPDKIHTINISFTTESHRKSFGGGAGNIAYSLSLLGLKPVLRASAGGDFTPYKNYLQKNRVDISKIKIYKKMNTASGFVITDQADNQIWGFSKGAMTKSKDLSIKKLLKSLVSKNKNQGRNASDDVTQNVFVVLAPCDPKAMEGYLNECLEMGVSFSFDPAFYIPEMPQNVLKKGVENAKIIFGNDYEMAMICKKLNIKNPAKGEARQGRQKLKINNDILHKRGGSGFPAVGSGRLFFSSSWSKYRPIRGSENKQVWVTTLGEKGSIIEIQNPCLAGPLRRIEASRQAKSEIQKINYHGHCPWYPQATPSASLFSCASSTTKTHGFRALKIKIKPAKPKNTSDPTGAGDAYRAGFLSGYLKGFDLRTCGQMGSICAVYTVEKYGTITHRFTIKEFEKRYKENFGKELRL